MSSSRHTALLGVVWIALQLVVPFARADLSRRPPFSPRFSWSMFAGRPIARCAHALTWTSSANESLSLPLPPSAHPARRVLAARTADEFARVVPLLTAYAESDETVVSALHDLLRRHKRAVDPDGRFTLTSTLDCRTHDDHSTRHTLRLVSR